MTAPRTLGQARTLADIVAYYRRPRFSPPGRQVVKDGADCSHPLCDGWHPTGPTYPSHVHITPMVNAVSLARDELSLRAAESADRIRFEWVYDNDYQPDGDCGIPEEEARHLDAGSWEVLGCRAEVPAQSPPRHCPTCTCPPDPSTWEEVASLWGIVLDVDDQFDYRREVERDLAAEAGVLD